MSIKSGVSAGEGFKATGDVVAKSVDLDGKVTEHRALQMSDIAAPVEDSKPAPRVLKSGTTGSGLNY